MGLLRGRRGRREKDWEFGFSRCKLLCKEWKNTKVIMYSTENYIQSPGINNNVKKCVKNRYMYITESLYCTAETGTTL